MKESNANGRCGYLDVLRILSAFAVVVIHLCSGTVSTAQSVAAGTALACDTVHTLMNFSVPMFLMISGALFLNNATTYTYGKIWRNIRRVLLCLVGFGLVYSLLEQLFVSRSVHVLWAVRDIFTGNLWDHMWYLYMIVGIYLLVPLIKPFFVQAARRDVVLLLALLFLFNSVFPQLETAFSVKPGFSLPLNSMYLFYFLAGGLLFRWKPVQKNKGFALSGAAVLITAAAIIAVSVAGWEKVRTDYGSGLVCLYTMGIFVLCKLSLEGYVPSGRVIGLSNLTWGIYLLHPLFLNVVLKALHWNPVNHLPAVSMPVLAVCVFAASGAVIYIARKIPPVEKYIL